MADLTDAERQALISKFENTYGSAAKQQAVNDTAVPRDSGKFISPETSPNIGPWEAAGRGAASGLMLGFEPQVAAAGNSVGNYIGLGNGKPYDEMRDQEAAANERAWQQQKLAYGTGYAGGSILPALASGGIGSLGSAAKATRAAATAAEKASPFITKSTGSVLSNIHPVDATRSLMSTPLLPKHPAVGTIGTTIQGATGIINSQGNGPKTAPPVEQPGGNITGTPISKADSTPDFGSLVDFLRQAQSSDNPDVQKLAQQTQSELDQSDEDKKRQIAMQLQSSTIGRAVGNEDSPVNYS